MTSSNMGTRPCVPWPNQAKRETWNQIQIERSDSSCQIFRTNASVTTRRTRTRDWRWPQGAAPSCRPPSRWLQSARWPLEGPRCKWWSLPQPLPRRPKFLPEFRPRRSPFRSPDPPQKLPLRRSTTSCPERASTSRSPARPWDRWPGRLILGSIKLNFLRSQCGNFGPSLLRLIILRKSLLNGL